MHELSVAQSLVEIVAAQLEGEPPDARVAVVRVRIGALAGVAPEALRSSFPIAAAGTRLEGARLAVEEAPLVVWCPNCGQERTLAGPQRLRCPECGARTPDVRGGRELDVSSVELCDLPPRR